MCKILDREIVMSTEEKEMFRNSQSKDYHIIPNIVQATEEKFVGWEVDDLDIVDERAANDITN